MQVLCNEGLASHIGPEPCVRIREGAGEASVGESIGWAIEPRKIPHPGCRRCYGGGRQDGRACYRECPHGPAWSKTPACADAPRAGTGRSLVWPRNYPWSASGRPKRP